MTSPIYYLLKYMKMQNNIVLCKGLEGHELADRCKFMGENYSAHKTYKHRSILHNEVVIEYDEENKSVNKFLTEKCVEKLRKDNMIISKWYSGGKSYHIHLFIDVKNAQDIPTLKRAFMIYYGNYKEYKPDMQLSGGHLIRMEHTKHEKTGNYKKPIHIDKKYPYINELPIPVWNMYARLMRKQLQAAKNVNYDKLQELPGFKHLLETEDFRNTNDGRERALFFLIHVLKKQYDSKEEFVQFLQQWYKYSGGKKLDNYDIQKKVDYHWDKHYSVSEKYLNNLLYDIGRQDLIQR